EGYAGLDTYNCLLLAKGKFNPDYIPVNFWDNIYGSIRICNLFLENSHLANDRLLVEGEVETYNMDVRFLRAFYYSLLLELYGPFVIIDHTVDYSSSDFPTRRNTVDECVDFLVKEFDAVIEKLPHQADIIQTDLGRPSKGAAMAAKARVLLWSASKLVNGNKDYETTFVNDEKTPYINPVYDENKWHLAAQAYKDIIDLGSYQLFTLPADEKTVPLGNFPGNNVAWPDGPAGIDPYRSFKALFAGGLNYWNSETIWQINIGNQKESYTRLGFPRGHKTTLGNESRYTGPVGAIQKIIDAFFMNNGKTIEEENNALYWDLGPASTSDGYYIQGRQTSEASPIKTNWLASSSAQAPPVRVLNREARFYATFGFQGRGYKQDDLATPWYYADYRNGTSDGYYETDRPSYRSGYPIVKWVNDEDITVTGNYPKQCPVYRLAEVYLSYAEALNEYNPANPDIVKYLNLVRYRAGLPGYELADQATNLQRIKHERYVELAYETGKRYFDMRRWMDADKVQRDQWGNSLGVGGIIYGCNYLATDASFYDRLLLDGYIFKKRDYFFPLPYVQVANHWGTMSQNPGW
ncbi:RagB/SusD family nutrient uptake outer membrane protein, partial [termite gut metagenome]